MGRRPGFGLCDSMGVRQAARSPVPGCGGCGGGGKSWGRSLGPEGPRTILASAWPSPLGQQNMWLKCR